MILSILTARVSLADFNASDVGVNARLKREARQAVFDSFIPAETDSGPKEGFEFGTFERKTGYWPVGAGDKLKMTEADDDEDDMPHFFAVLSHQYTLRSMKEGVRLLKGRDRESPDDHPTLPGLL